MGHVYSVFVAGAAANTGSSAIPHFGQSPDPCWRTSGSIGQVYSFEVFEIVGEIGATAFGATCASGERGGGGATCKGFDVAGAIPTSIFGIKYFAGSAQNFSWQPRQQK